MKVLVVGGGGREHALAWKIAASPLVEEVLCAPGNPGTARVDKVRNVEVSATDYAELEALCVSSGVGLVVIGPEDPLVDGLADRLRARDILVFGPGADGAKLEGSKLFTKEILTRHRIPTAGWRRFDRAGAAKAYLESCTSWPQVIKADGLAAGKGVSVCADLTEACAVVDRLMEEKVLGAAGTQIVIEECLRGQEVSVHAITDGQALLVLEAVVDHKQVGEGDTGPNTGGMGVVSPVEFLSTRLMRQVEQRILLPTLHALRVEGIDYRGLLYAGLMMTDSGPQVIEYNCRFGDPETQAIVRRLKTDLVPYLVAAAEAKLGEQVAPEWDSRACVGVVAASEGYPGSYEKGRAITGLERAEADADAVVFHAGTAERDGKLVTSGGRVLCVTALGQGLEEAREHAYHAYDSIEWSGKFCRRDIGLRGSVAPQEEEDAEAPAQAGPA